MGLSRVYVAGFLLALASCSEDDEPSSDARCGAGTVLSGGECVAAQAGGNGGNDGKGGTAGIGGSAGAFAGSNNGGTTAPGSAGDAGSAAAGPQNGGTGGDSELAGAGAGGADPGLGGNGGDGSVIVAGGAGGDGSVGGDGGAPAIGSTQWLAFSHAEGLFAYDAALFPALTFEQLSAQPPFTLQWSPDGSLLIYNEGANIWARDMTGDVPGDPHVVIEWFDLAPRWSGDSQSLAAVDAGTLYVVDPRESAPILHVVSNEAMGYSWAPSGAWMLYYEPSGTYVVNVVGGLPGEPIKIADTPLLSLGYMQWSPDGSRVLLLDQDERTLSLYDLDAGAPSATVLVDATSGGSGGAANAGGAGSYAGETALPSVSVGTFDASGARIAFEAALAPPQSQVYYVGLDGTLPAEVTLADPLLAGEQASDLLWSGSSWLLYYRNAGFTSSYSVVDLSAGAPGSPVPLDFAGLNFFAWVQRSNRLLAFGESSESLHLIEVTNGSASDTTVLSTPGEAILDYTYTQSPVTNVIAASTTQELRFVDLDAPDELPNVVSFFTGYQTDAVSAPLWSADGKLALVPQRLYSWNPDRYDLFMMSVDGKETSSPISLKGVSTTSIRAAWQPKP